MKNDAYLKITALTENLKNADASQISASLKEIGDGDMKDGIKKLIEYVPQSTRWKNFAAGGAVGAIAVGSAVALCKLIKWACKQAKESDVQGQKILKALESTMTPEELAAAEATEIPDEPAPDKDVLDSHM